MEMITPTVFIRLSLRISSIHSHTKMLEKKPLVDKKLFIIHQFKIKKHQKLGKNCSWDA